MNVALIDPSLYTWAYDRELIQGLRNNDVDANLYAKHLAEHEAPGSQREHIVQHFYAGLARGPLSKLSGGLALAVKGVSHAVSLTRLVRRFENTRPEVIHFQWTPLPVMDQLYLPALRRIAPLVLTVHDSTPFNGNPGGSKLQKLGAVKILSEFDGLIVHTAEAGRRLVTYGIDERRISIIPHGLLQEGGPDMSRLSPAENVESLVSFLLFGKIKPYKGVDVVIRALALLPKSVLQRCQVRVVGKPYMELSPLRELAKRLGVANAIAFDPRLIPEQELPSLFGAANVVVMPYRQIDASGVLMMALVSGRPIIASNIGNFAETLTSEQNALLVEPDAPAKLAEAMARVIEESELRTRLADGVRTLRQTIPSWTEIGSRTAQVYARLVKNRMG